MSDDKLLEAIKPVICRQADALGDGVYKKRLGLNDYRSIIAASGHRYQS